MAFLRKKKSRGKTYYYVAESKRVNGKPRVVNEVYVGPIERIRELALGATLEKQISKLQVLEWGSLAAVEAIEREIGLVDIVNNIVPKRKQGISVGEYIYLAVMNRCIAPKSKRVLSEWFKKRALFEFRSVDLSLLSSQRFWDHFSVIDQQAIDQIGRTVAEKVVARYHPAPDWFLFDTTNFYTFMDALTSSKLCRPGYNKQGRHNLRQIGLALLIDRAEGIPLYHQVYAGNMHDSTLFRCLLENILELIHSFGKTKEKLTLVFDKGINAEETMSQLDDDLKVHFVTSYSCWHIPRIAATKLDSFAPLGGTINTDRDPEDHLLAYRTSHELWGKDRTVIVTYNPKTARKKEHRFEQKLDTVRQELLTVRRKVRDQAPHWRDGDTIKERVVNVLTEHKAKSFFSTEVKEEKGKLVFSFRQRPYYVQKTKDLMGRQVLVTDRTDLSTEDIVSAYTQRNRIEDRYKQMKSPFKIAFMPQYHWTDQKIRVHMLTCTLALTYLAVMNCKLKQSGITESIDTVMESLRELHSCLIYQSSTGKPIRQLETMSSLQKKALAAMNKTH
jgi:transposase